MPTGASCPISGALVDSTGCRVAAVLTFFVLVASLFSGVYWLVGLVAVEFLLRLTLGLGKSPVGLLARAISRAYGLPQRMVDAAPKRFAAIIALALSTVAFVAGTFAGSEVVFAIMTGVFAACTAFEGFLGLCLGCKVYALLPRTLTDLRHAREVLSDG